MTAGKDSRTHRRPTAQWAAEHPREVRLVVAEITHALAPEQARELADELRSAAAKAARGGGTPLDRRPRCRAPGCRRPVAWTRHGDRARGDLCWACSQSKPNGTTDALARARPPAKRTRSRRTP